MKKIVFIDTGVNKKYAEEKNIQGISVKKNGTGEYSIDEAFGDDVGHGTSVVDVFVQNICNDVEIFVVKAYDNENFGDIDNLCYALKYVKDTIKCDIVQISSGIIFGNNKLKKLVDDICDKDIIVIAAFDNEGSMSYPAAYENVLGIDLDEDIEKKTFNIYNSDIVDIRVAVEHYRTIDHNMKRVLRIGSSFACSVISAMILNKSINKEVFDKKMAKKVLGLKEKKQLKKEEAYEPKHFMDNVKTLVLFPFNKEIQSIARFEEVLREYKLYFFDVKYSFAVGKK